MCLVSNWTRFSCGSGQETTAQEQEPPTEVTATAINIDEYGNLPKVGEIVVSGKTQRYKLIKLLGKGGYGQVFESVDQENRRFAIKVEKFFKSKLNNEADVLMTATQHRCTRILKFIEYSYSKPNYYFLVMPLLGKDLSHLRNEQLYSCFSLSTTIRVAISTLFAIQELHWIGFVHKDIKPRNFAIGRDYNNRHIFLFDFGLARRYLDSNKNHIPLRKNAGWRGTTRYGSLQAHLKRDLSRKDDMESWFYMLVELTKGNLPWRFMSDRASVQAAKMSARTETRSTFLEDCPNEYDEILTLVDSLTFPDVPPYIKIVELLKNIMKTYSYTWEQRYDWEDRESTASTIINSIRGEAQEEDISSKNEFQQKDQTIIVMPV